MLSFALAVGWLQLQLEALTSAPIAPSAEAVLGDAIAHDLTEAYDQERRWHRAQAQAWLAGRRSGPLSLEACCEALGLEPAAVRAAVKRNPRKRREPRPVKRGRAPRQPGLVQPAA